MHHLVKVGYMKNTRVETFFSKVESSGSESFTVTSVPPQFSLFSHFHSPYIRFGHHHSPFMKIHTLFKYIILNVSYTLIKQIKKHLLLHGA